MTIQTRHGRFRHTVILAATEKGLEHFESVDAMPPLLRAQCRKALESRESGTVVIAGQAGSGAEPPPVCNQAAERSPATASAAQGKEALLALWLRLAVAAAAAAAILLHWRS